jgi:hypothetical protein
VRLQQRLLEVLCQAPDVHFVDVLVGLQNVRKNVTLATPLQSLTPHHEVEPRHRQQTAQHSAKKKKEKRKKKKIRKRKIRKGKKKKKKKKKTVSHQLSQITFSQKNSSEGYF